MTIKHLREDNGFTLNMPVEETLKFMPRKPEDETITFMTAGKERMLLKGNGDIFINGRLAENDKDVVQGMREFLSDLRTPMENKFTLFVNKETFDQIIDTLGYIPCNLKINVAVDKDMAMVVNNEEIKAMMKPKLIASSKKDTAK